MDVPHIKGNGEYDLEIVGESHYQAALVRIAGRHTAKGRRVECEAELYLEPNNPYDRNAVRVEIQGATVGHIARDLAPEMREELAKLGIRNGQRVKVDAVILGGRTGQSYGVWLDVPVLDDDGDDEDDEEEVNVVSVAAIKPSTPRAVTQPSPPKPVVKTATSPSVARYLAWLLVGIVVTMVGIYALFALTMPTPNGRRVRATVSPVTAPTALPGGLRLNTPTPDLP